VNKGPLAKWEDNDSRHENLVWWSRLDNRYQIEVQRTGERAGDLVIYDHSDGDKELLRESVGLSYGARFGPDVSDVEDWKERAVKFVDGLEQ